MNTETKLNVYDIASSHVLHHLNRGIIPWHSGWTERGFPSNLVTQLEYRGLNSFLLAALNYPKNIFINPKQLDELGGVVKKGQQAHPVFYWKHEKAEPGNPQLIFRYSYVYNISQCDNIKKSMLPKIERPKNPFVLTISTIAHMRKLPAISHGLQPPCYMPILDCIDLPKKESFANDEAYFSALFRCLIHSTGHKSRLNRREVTQSYVSDEGKYSLAEELIGDMGAALLANITGIKYVPMSDGEDHIAKWIECFLSDSHLIVYVSAQAQKAVDYILNRPRN